MARGQVSPTCVSRLLCWRGSLPSPYLSPSWTPREALSVQRLLPCLLVLQRRPRGEVAAVIYLQNLYCLWKLIILFSSLLFLEFVPVEARLLDLQTLGSFQSLVGEILYLRGETLLLLLSQEQAPHCYGYRIHIFWIFLLFQSFEKISQTRVRKL